MAFIIQPTSFEGVFMIEYDILSDARGDFSELYHESRFQEQGIDTIFVQDNLSTSKKGVLRGLHFQKNHPQTKLILPISGKIYDAIVDIRKDSPTFGKSHGFFLEKGKGLYVSSGFAHGFLALSDTTVLYKCDDFYHPDDEGGILWNDENLDIPWQKLFDEYEILEPILSGKDKQLPPFSLSLLEL